MGTRACSHKCTTRQRGEKASLFTTSSFPAMMSSLSWSRSMECPGSIQTPVGILHLASAPRRCQRRHHQLLQIFNVAMLESVLSSTISIAVTIEYPTWLFGGKKIQRHIKFRKSKCLFYWL